MATFLEPDYRRALLTGADAQSHFIQFYEPGNDALAVNAAAYIGTALTAGAPAIIIATPEHGSAIVSRLRAAGLPTDDLKGSGQLTVLDAAITLQRFVINGHPDAERFDRLIGGAVRAAVDRENGRQLRAYGEMVGVLWSQRQYPAAIRLEQLWNKLRQELPFSLFCWYPVDIFGGDFDSGVVDALLCAHSHLLPYDDRGTLEGALARAMEEVLGGESGLAATDGAQRVLKADWAAVPPAESTILWIRRNAPQHADRVLSLAREYYTASLAV